jgi:hypothetical protein
MTHYIIGSGSFGCLYDNGPHAHRTLKDAVEDLAQTFELGRVRRAQLRRDGFLKLGPSFGADYCEITECTCDTPWQHNEDDSSDNWK